MKWNEKKWNHFINPAGLINNGSKCEPPAWLQCPAHSGSSPLKDTVLNNKTCPCWCCGWCFSRSYIALAERSTWSINRAAGWNHRPELLAGLLTRAGLVCLCHLTPRKPSDTCLSKRVCMYASQPSAVLWVAAPPHEQIPAMTSR